MEAHPAPGENASIGLLGALVGAGAIPAGTLVCGVSRSTCLGKCLPQRTGVVCDLKGRWSTLQISHQEVAAVAPCLSHPLIGFLNGTQDRGESYLQGAERGSGIGAAAASLPALWEDSADQSAGTAVPGSSYIPVLGP